MASNAAPTVDPSDAGTSETKTSVGSSCVGDCADAGSQPVPTGTTESVDAGAPTVAADSGATVPADDAGADSGSCHPSSTFPAATVCDGNASPGHGYCHVTSGTLAGDYADQTTCCVDGCTGTPCSLLVPLVWRAGDASVYGGSDELVTGYCL